MINLYHSLRWYLSDNYYAIKWLFQRWFRGYSDNEVWALYDHASKWMLPRLKVLRATHHGVPAEFADNWDAWGEILDKMIYSLQRIIDDNSCDESAWVRAEEWPKIQEGLDLLGKHWMSLWD